MGESEYSIRSIIDDFMNCRDIVDCKDCEAHKLLSGFNNTQISSCQLLRYYLTEVTNKINYLLENEL